MEPAKMNSKTCRACRIEKLLDEFPPDRRAKDGRQARCRQCISAWIKDHYHRHPAEHMLKRAKARAKSHGFEFDISLSDILPLPKVCRSEEHTSELQSLMRISYAVFCLKKKKNKTDISYRDSKSKQKQGHKHKYT